MTNAIPIVRSPTIGAIPDKFGVPAVWGGSLHYFGHGTISRLL